MNDFENKLQETINKMENASNMSELDDLYKTSKEYLWLIYSGNVKKFLDEPLK